MADYRCARCQWSAARYDALECRKNPPVVDPPREGHRGMFPVVHPAWWCGQFSPKRQEPWTATVEGRTVPPHDCSICRRPDCTTEHACE